MHRHTPFFFFFFSSFSSPPPPPQSYFLLLLILLFLLHIPRTEPQVRLLRTFSRLKTRCTILLLVILFSSISLQTRQRSRKFLQSSHSLVSQYNSVLTWVWSRHSAQPPNLRVKQVPPPPPRRSANSAISHNKGPER